MLLKFATSACSAGQVLPLAPPNGGFALSHNFYGQILPDLSVGSELFLDGKPQFVLSGKCWLPGPARAWLLQALTTIESRQPREYAAQKAGLAIAVITLSDKGAKGLREDKSGPLLAKLLAANLKTCLCQNFILPDEAILLRGLLADLALNQGFDLICTSGGTGLGPRDITPQVTESLLELRLPGFEQAMTAAGLAKTPKAAISRAVAGVIGKCLVINLPGSVSAVTENLASLLPCLEHAIQKLQGDQTDCGV